MPRFTFLSGPGCGNVFGVEMYGIDFPRNVPVEVEDIPRFGLPNVVAKLRGNPFFREELDPADTDGDGTVSRAELYAQADAAGVDYDKRWGTTRLVAAIAAANPEA